MELTSGPSKRTGAPRAQREHCLFEVDDKWERTIPHHNTITLVPLFSLHRQVSRWAEKTTNTNYTTPIRVVFQMKERHSSQICFHLRECLRSSGPGMLPNLPHNAQQWKVYRVGLRTGLIDAAAIDCVDR